MSLLMVILSFRWIIMKDIGTLANKVKAQHSTNEGRIIIATVTFKRNATTTPQSICDLRESVGWDRADEDYPAALQGYWGTVSGFDDAGTLVAWCAILSDGVRHGVLIDVIVHPAWQRQGVGLALAREAIAFIQEHRITIIHVDFGPEHRAFYERCGFETSLAGIIEG